MTNEATIGMAVNSARPISQGLMKAYPLIASRVAIEERAGRVTPVAGRLVTAI